ncbi:hypothetical protein JB92DRAFT_3054484 [Gautieria morchelliformis]|nr:hypothetical protein JB92DRAFT_3054484 [Gautieria morchelliformis]
MIFHALRRRGAAHRWTCRQGFCGHRILSAMGLWIFYSLATPHLQDPPAVLTLCVAVCLS